MRPVVRVCSLKGWLDLPFSWGAVAKVRVVKQRKCLFYTFLNSPIIQQSYQVIYDGKQPDLIFLDPDTPTAHQFYRMALAARRMFGWSPMLIAPYYENINMDLRWLDRTFSSNPPSAKNITLGGGIPWLMSLDWSRYRKAPKSKFCNYLFSNDWLLSTATRRAFCKLLMRYKSIDRPGQSINNMRMPVSSFGIAEAKLSFIKDYRFTIAFENRSTPSYVTEKICQAFTVGSIPIYWGCPRIADYFNSNSFINCHEYHNFEQVVERVIAIDNDPKLYARYVNASPTRPGNYYHHIIPRLQIKWEAILAESLARRQEKKVYDYAQLGLMMLNSLPAEIIQLSKIAKDRVQQVACYLVRAR